MVFDPSKHRGNGAIQQPEPEQVEQQQPEQNSLEALDQTFGYLDDTIPGTPPEWEGDNAPPYSDAELSRWFDESADVEEPDESGQAPAKPQHEQRTTPAGFLINPRPVIPEPFVQHLFNMKTINEINAGPGVGKTTLLSMLAACVATGRPFLDAFMVRRGVSVFFTEDAETVTNCISAWQLEWGVNILDHVLICDKPAAITDTTKVKAVKEIGPDGREVERVVQLPNPVWGEEALRQIKEIRNFAGDRPVCMVVFDSKSFHLSSAMRNGKPLDENSNDDQQYITFCGYRFVKALGACGIFVPHVSKESERSPHLILESRGGGAAKGAVWKTFSLTLDKTNPERVIMAAGKRRGGGISQLLRLTRQSMAIFPADQAEQAGEIYRAGFEGAIPPAQPLEGLRPIDPLFCGGYLNECELVDEEQLAAELAEHLGDEKKKARSEGKAKPTGAEQKVLDVLIQYCRGRCLQREFSKICEEKLRSHRSNILRSIRNLIEKQYITAFDELNGDIMLTSNNASIPPLNER